MEEKKQVLVAEDNIVNQKLATLLLQQLGLDTHIAENGQMAVNAVQKRSYDVILMDCQMPQMDGFEATKAIRKLESLSNKYTPIIAVTALAMVGDRERCIAVGMDDYISKPIDRQVLKIKLNHWLQREFVVRNQVLSKKYAQPVESASDRAEYPIDLPELREFYGDDLQDVLQSYLNSTVSYIAAIDDAINTNDHETLARVAHELKGSSASVGAKQLAKLALYLERAAGMHDWSEARDTRSALINSFDLVRVFLERSQSSLSEAVILPIRD